MLSDLTEICQNLMTFSLLLILPLIHSISYFWKSITLNSKNKCSTHFLLKAIYTWGYLKRVSISYASTLILACITTMIRENLPFVLGTLIFFLPWSPFFSTCTICSMFIHFNPYLCLHSGTIIVLFLVWLFPSFFLSKQIKLCHLTNHFLIDKNLMQLSFLKNIRKYNSLTLY